jgi:hypothetical protein
MYAATVSMAFLRSVRAQHRVHRINDVQLRIDQRSVQIEKYRAHLPFFIVARIP